MADQEEEKLIDDLAAMDGAGDSYVLAYLNRELDKIKEKNTPEGKDIPMGCLTSPIGLMAGAVIATAIKTDIYLGMAVGAAAGFGVALLASKLRKKSKAK